MPSRPKPPVLIATTSTSIKLKIKNGKENGLNITENSVLMVKLDSPDEDPMQVLEDTEIQKKRIEEKIMRLGVAEAVGEDAEAVEKLGARVKRYRVKRGVREITFIELPSGAYSCIAMG